MGIPSYFSYIVKNHIHIIQKLRKNAMQVNNLYLDCNSIIYDAVHNIDFTKLDDTDVNTIIKKVIIKIEEYIILIQPNNTVYIAFDGVAPVAKLEQQRQRRYKSLYQNEMLKTIYQNTKPDPWNTTAITPGTKFMEYLNKTVAMHFNDPTKYGVNKMICSGSNEAGEGEHKLFQHIRNYPEEHKNATSIVYGLDADLIMLTINHLPISEKIYLFRETPHFIKSINVELEPNDTYYMDIPELAKIITNNMNNGNSLTSEQQKNRIYDYIFLCFFLGNDFMPHFPSVNIRTGGVDKMLNAYKATLGGTNENLTDGKKIYWNNVRKLVRFLADMEEENFKMEMKLRDRREKNTFYPTTTPEEMFKKFEAIPTYEREIEKYINPFKENWRVRYYKGLFDFDMENNESHIIEEFKQNVCINYLEGLEWTMKYYTMGCPDWRWKYNYCYPPLFKDLIHHIPVLDREFIKPELKTKTKPVSELTQLCYVLPYASLHLLPEKLYKYLKTYKKEWYKTDCEFMWAYCRYFWESHVVMSDIDMNELEKIIEKFKLNKL